MQYYVFCLHFGAFFYRYYGLYKFFLKKLLTFLFHCDIICKRVYEMRKFGGLAQLARASGSYPAGRWFKSDIRYQTRARWSSGQDTALSRL